MAGAVLALAGTLKAGLKLAPAEVLALEQDSAWAAVRVTGRRNVAAPATAVTGSAG